MNITTYNSLRFREILIGFMLVGFLFGFAESAYADLSTIEITPATANMNVGDQQQFTATGKDDQGNPVPVTNPVWEYTGGGVMIPNGTSAEYTAMDTGDYQISCKQAGTAIRGTADIHTTDPDKLATIEIKPATANLQVGDQQQFTATGKDGNGNPMTIPNPVWQTSGGGTIDPNGTKCKYTATEAGDSTISCKQAGTAIQGTANIHTTGSGGLSTIEVTPASVDMQVGDQQQFTATGKDADGNPVTITNPVWEAPGGTLTPNGTSCTYTATQAGDFTISCKEDGTTIQGTANIHTTGSGGLSTIEVTPASVDMHVGDQQQFTATGKDAQGNEVSIDATWSTNGGTITTGSGGLYTAIEQGDFTVIASVFGSPIIGTARVHVGPDNDRDAIRDSAENSAPNNGDGNGDGVPDSQQANVTSLLSAKGKGYITVETTCSQNQDVWAYTEKQASLGAKFDYDYSYAYGLVGFKLPCTSATVRIYFHGTGDLTGYIYRKYGPIPPDFDKPQWYTLPNVTYGTTMIGGKVVAYVEFVLVDGQLGDDTGVDGQIIEPGGPALTAGDFNMDLVVDFRDLQFLADQWLCGPESDADLDGSGLVDNVDFALFSQNWQALY